MKYRTSNKNTTNNAKEFSPEKFIAITSFIICAIVFSLIVLHFFLGYDIPAINLKNIETASYWGQIGDFSGGMLNPILSFLALIAVIYNLSLQRKGMEDARTEAREANIIQDKQTNIYKKQAFESSVISLVGLHSKIASEVRFRDAVGTEAIWALHTKLMNLQTIISARHNPIELSETLEAAERFMTEHSRSLGHYFRNIYQILKFIDDHESLYEFNIHDLGDDENRWSKIRNTRRFRLDYVEKRRYANILRAQLSEQ